MHKGHDTAAGIEHQLRENIAKVRGRIAEACARSRRDPDFVRVVTVTKYVSDEVVHALLKLGVRDLGENRVQHLVERAVRVSEFVQRNNATPLSDPIPDPRWHMIGYLQRNKVKPLLPVVGIIHSVDRLRLAEEINKRAQTTVDVLIEVNGGDEPQKSGAAVCAAAHLAEQVASMPNLRVRGLMSMAPLSDDEAVVRHAFTRVAELYEETRSDYAVGDAFNLLSMGMSSDFEIAIECGANLLRIGSAFFEGIERVNVPEVEAQ